jgi:UDP-N-acetylmuramoylalanine--D-glutamate ligase
MEVRGLYVSVIGLGVSGRAAACLLARRGARVFGSDAAPEPMSPEQAAALQAEGIAFELGGHTPRLLERCDLVVLSPGVEPYSGPADEALQRGLPVYSEIEAASWYFGGAVIGITGSNGKSTTTAMCAEMLGAAGIPAYPGGNLGRPFATLLDEEPGMEVAVLELSSFQLERIERFRADTGVMLNITPDHLDRYRSLEEYETAKYRLWETQRAGDWAVFGADDPGAVRSVAGIAASPIPFTLGTPPAGPGVWVEDRDGEEIVRMRHPGTRNLEPEILFGAAAVPLPGRHNLTNAMAAAAAARRHGAPPEAIERALRSFRGLPHRLQLVGQVGGVRFYDDSKATNVESAVAALSGFERGVVLIAGGKHKGSSYIPMREPLALCGKAAVLIGQARAAMQEEFAGVVPLHEAVTLEEAVEQAWRLARPDGVVLLAPACSSFDMFRDYNHRGEVFQTSVQRLITREVSRP